MLKWNHRAFVLLPAVVSLFAGAATAQTSDDAANRRAYEASIKCFVANGLARGERLDAGDTATAAIHEANARRSFDFALQFGAKLGLTGTTINEDFSLAQSAEMPKMVANSGYYRDAVATCKAIGLM